MSSFECLIGQSCAVELLTQAIVRQRIAPAYLFTGADGVGRSVAARCFTELLFQHNHRSQQPVAGLRHRIWQRNHPDLLWVEPTYLHQGKRFTAAEAIAAEIKRKTSPIIRLEQIREISQFLGRSPLEASHSVVVIEQAETMAEAAANALLKTLEEPGQATLILITRSVDALLPTLVSRCQRIPFVRLSVEDVATVLRQVGQAEILEHPDILQLAQGSPGAAIAHWQQFQTIPAELLQQATQPLRSYREALSLARQIQHSLELDSQLWLIDLLQHYYWQSISLQFLTAATSGLRSLHQLEQSRDYLRQNVNPRLVWEVMLMQMVS